MITKSNLFGFLVYVGEYDVVVVVDEQERF